MSEPGAVATGFMLVNFEPSPFCQNQESGPGSDKSSARKFCVINLTFVVYFI